MSNGATPTRCLLVTDPARDAPQLRSDLALGVGYHTRGVSSMRFASLTP